MQMKFITISDTCDGRHGVILVVVVKKIATRFCEKLPLGTITADIQM